MQVPCIDVVLQNKLGYEYRFACGMKTSYIPILSNIDNFEFVHLPTNNLQLSLQSNPYYLLKKPFKILVLYL